VPITQGWFGVERKGKSQRDWAGPGHCS